jgi:hypothetical protein
MKINKNVHMTHTKYEDFEIIGIEEHDEFTGEDHKATLEPEEISAILEAYPALENKEGKQVSSSIAIRKQNDSITIYYYDDYIEEKDTLFIKWSTFQEIAQKVN